jgi:FdhD protein
MTLKGISEREVTRLGLGSSNKAGAADWVAVEEPLEIRVAGDSVAITMRTPGDDARLAVGFLFSEGILRSIDDLGSVAHCGKPTEEGFGNVIEVTAAPGVTLDVEKVQASRRGTLTTSACGVCGRRSVDDLLALCGRVENDLTIDSEVLIAAPRHLKDLQRNFSHTGGTHAAAILSPQGEVLATFEDVGRHNAVDKVIGHLVMKGQISRRSFRPPAAESKVPPPAILVVSGRASFEIVQKATVAGIPVVASVSAASSLAIDLAKRSNITLAAFVRGGSFNLYTCPERIEGRKRTV